MTTDDLRTRAREAAWRRLTPFPPISSAQADGYEDGFADGAEWHAAQQPSRERLAEVLYRLRSVCQGEREVIERLDQASSLAAAAVPHALVEVIVKVSARGTLTAEDLDRLGRAGYGLPPQYALTRDDHLEEIDRLRTALTTWCTQMVSGDDIWWEEAVLDLRNWVEAGAEGSPPDPWREETR